MKMTRFVMDDDDLDIPLAKMDCGTCQTSKGLINYNDRKCCGTYRFACRVDLSS